MKLAALTCSIALIGCAPVHAKPVCQEDQPCWNWATMGNHHRGIVTMHGTPLVVSPCQFQRLMRARNVDYRGQDMKGDKLAMRIHCP